MKNRVPIERKLIKIGGSIYVALPRDKFTSNDKIFMVTSDDHDSS